MADRVDDWEDKEIKRIIADLDEYSKEHGLTQPLYTVYEKRRYPTTVDYSGDFTYFDSPNDCVECDDMASLRGYIKEIDGYREDMTDEEVEEFIKENTYIEKLYYFDVDVFKTACLTRTGAENYLKQNGHNLNKPVIYKESLYRNEEMITIRKLLRGIQAITKEGILEWHEDDILITEGEWKGYYRSKDLDLEKHRFMGVLPDMASIGYSPSYVYGKERYTIQKFTGFSIELVKEKFTLKPQENGGYE
jgi:hypothetical protein